VGKVDQGANVSNVVVPEPNPRACYQSARLRRQTDSGIDPVCKFSMTRFKPSGIANATYQV
jgi:hypothetical protein